MAQPDNPLAGILAARIGSDGPMTVADYMAAALTEPGAGYYMTGDPFGSAGDFITAPEISQVFGELIGLWSAQCWQSMGSPPAVNLVELGPGRGTLMADALRASGALPAFKAAIQVHLVETSPSLRLRQQETLSDHRVIWHEDLSSLPEGPLIVIANEFFDALPVHQLERSDEGWLERLVTLSPLSSDRAPVFSFTTGRPGSGLVDRIPADFRTAIPGTLIEVSPAMDAVAGELGRRLADGGGTALVIDYGHSRSQAGWSLQALRGHRRHNPLVTPGQADLTVHVDFAAIADAAARAGARVWGPVTQTAFLTALGVRERTEKLRAGATEQQASALESGMRRLIDPEEMGELFKVIAFGHPDLPGPPGLPHLSR